MAASMRHFKSRDALLAAAVERLFDVAVSAIDRIEGQARPGRARPLSAVSISRPAIVTTLRAAVLCRFCPQRSSAPPRRLRPRSTAASTGWPTGLADSCPGADAGRRWSLLGEMAARTCRAL